MCGIFGTVNYSISREEFQQRLDTIKHRGPDGFGIWENRTGNVKLGHRRLAIIDTDSRSNQPMIFNERYAIVFNGEIYNYIELKKELLQKGVQFVTESDTEVLFHLMLLEGPAALSKLNGMWSLVMFDEQEQSFFMSRDRIGKKPLYYIHEGEQFAFASEMKALYKCLPQFSYNKPFIDFSLANPFDNEVLPDTIINGIHKFPVGCYAVYKNGELKISRYYFPEQLLEQKPAHKSFNEAVEQFRELFESSCTLRMRSDVPVGSALSGGIDSGYVVSTLGKLGFGKKGGYTALVSSFPGSVLDETKEALQVAANAGVPAVRVEVEPSLEPDYILRTVYEFEEMYLTSPISFFQSYKGFREKGIVVTLDGHGGDELFGGYPFDLDIKLKDDFPNIMKMRRTLTTIHNMYGYDGEIELKEAWLHFKSELRKKIKEKKTLSIFEEEKHYQAKLFHSTFKGILPTLLRNYDRYSMHAGVEVRMPFLDYRIIEFAFTLPNDYKVRNGFSKAIVREAAKGIVPEHILRNKLKSGWNSPMGEWLAGNWKQWLLDEVHSTAFNNCDLIDKRKVLNQTELFYETARFDQGAGQDLWLQLQPYLIEKANKQFAEL
ncbi:asparagine synthase (glutamine-hydrolyzing) [Lacibacter sediminis]|uniref:asparagine synthase (glutamine-hydrolyzing) n=1 Tax=Lacibacter sediminis TaxID=2760713 RepID=A0A7G5XHN5_9BACT|nr:asparagine synthase (glutamine-hydrolyzing) [Lacibacter sediminis]QNA44988.1 asparagine synthase (glutamine-hydrolyzing) [Lacibacter sediminis]